jgi:hypothetical protein
MAKKKVLLICGNYNQATMVHKIAQYLQDYDVWYSPYYADGVIGYLTDLELTDFSVLAGKPRAAAEKYLRENDLPVDYKGTANDYNVVVTPNDLLMPKNIVNKKVVLLQEGMMDPMDLKYHLVKNLKLPRYMANTSMTGLSHLYDTFCVMSEGWKELFISKGVKEETIVITGIPNFDNCESFLDNDFPYHNYILAATQHMRETLKFENRIQFIKRCVEIADGRILIFKLHPSEDWERATREVERWAPGSLIYEQANTNHMIANCDEMITRYSSVVLVATALGKKVHCDLDEETLKKLAPVQNKGTSAKNIADVCKQYLDG